MKPNSTFNGHFTHFPDSRPKFGDNNCCRRSLYQWLPSSVSLDWTIF